MLNACETIRAPGRSCRVRIGRSAALPDPSMYSVTTVAGETSAASDISEAKLDQMLDAGGLCVGSRLLDTPRIDVDAHAAGAVRLRGGDGDAAVPAAEVVDESSRVVPARTSMRSTTSSGVGT